MLPRSDAKDPTASGFGRRVLENAQAWVNYVWVTVVSVFVVLLLGVYVSQDRISSFPTLFVLMLLIAFFLGSPVFQHNRVKECIRKYFEHVTSHGRVEVDEMRDMVHEWYRPIIKVLSGQDDIAETAAGMVRRAHRHVVGANRYVVYFGAASIQTRRVTEFSPLARSFLTDEDELTPDLKYKAAVEAASGDKLRIYRYVRLWTEDEFGRRSENLKQEYLRWLQNQCYQMSRNPNFYVIDSPRAPAWGASGAMIVTSDSILSLADKDTGAIYLQDESLSELVRDHGRKSMIRVKKAENCVVYQLEGNEPDSVRDLLEDLFPDEEPGYFETLKSLHRRLGDLKESHQKLNDIFNPESA